MAIILYDLVGKDGARYSPYGWRVRMALAHKGLEATEELCWHSDISKLKFSGQTLVPVLVDGERVISDSWRIACYLDDAYSDRPPLMQGAQARSGARFLNVWMDGPIGRTLVSSLYLDILRNLHPDADAVAFRHKREVRAGKTLEELHARRGADFAQVNRDLAPLETLLNEQEFIAGDAPAYLDYIVFGTLQMPRHLGNIEVLQNQRAIARWQDQMIAKFDPDRSYGSALGPEAS